VACGRNAAKPHARTSDAKLMTAKSIVFDFGALFKGYCSDLTRTIYLGKMPPYLKDMYQVCLESQLAAIEAVKPGVRAADVDKVARTIITRAGFGKFFNHGLGHGLGLEVHEAPTLSRLSDQILVPGMVVTVEPGIYLPGKGGVRIEDDVLVTPKGCRVLSSLPKEMEQVIF
jgi:Xaa-Pro aminopeptidase